MAESSRGPELSATPDKLGLKPDEQKRTRRPLQQTPPSRFAEDEFSPSALPILPPAQNEGS